MDSYLDFANVYDELMDNIPYEEWMMRILTSMENYGISKPKRDSEDALESERNLVVDLGCGTGTLTELLYEKGYDMIGVDASDSMLAEAMEKREESGSQILYLLQDMSELELYCTVGTVISVCDSINYLVEDEALLNTIRLVHNYLYPGGLFIFDFNTDYKYREVIGESVIAENREDCSFIWENFYDEDSCINEYDLTLYILEENGLFSRHEETHFQKGLKPEDVRELLVSNGFEIVEFKDADSEEEVGDTSQRVYVCARCIKE